MTSEELDTIQAKLESSGHSVYVTSDLPLNLIAQIRTLRATAEESAIIWQKNRQELGDDIAVKHEALMLAIRLLRRFLAASGSDGNERAELTSEVCQVERAVTVLGVAYAHRIQGVERQREAMTKNWSLAIQTIVELKEQLRDIDAEFNSVYDEVEKLKNLIRKK